MKLWFGFACFQQLQRLPDMVILRFFEDDVGKWLVLGNDSGNRRIIDQAFPEVDRNNPAVFDFEVLQMDRHDFVSETFKSPFDQSDLVLIIFARDQIGWIEDDPQVIRLLPQG